MELLLFLTALFAGLTGAFSGERGDAVRQLQGAQAAVVRSAEVAQAAVQPARQAIAAVPRAANPQDAGSGALPAAAPLASRVPSSERRLE